MTTGENGLNLIIEFEGEILKVYDDGFSYPTAGVGHLLTAAEKVQYPIGTPITKEQSRAWLKQDLKEAEDAVNEAIKVNIKQNEFDAMVALAFNIGTRGFKNSSVVRNCNANQFIKAADAFLAWNKVKGKVVRGLTRRRTAERKLFLTPDSAASTIATLPPVVTPPSVATETPPPPTTSTTTVTDTLTNVNDKLSSVNTVSQTIESTVSSTSSAGTRIMTGAKMFLGIGSLIVGFVENNWEWLLLAALFAILAAYIWNNSRTRHDG